MQLFYSEELVSINQIVVLDSQESNHLSKVLRKQIGDTLYVTNGKGKIFEAEVVSINKKACSLESKKIIKDENNVFHLTIAIAPTKNIVRTEWFIEKSVELGIDKIFLFISENSERRAVKIERLQLKSLSAMKQSLKSFLPEISAPKKFKEIIDSSNEYEDKFIAYVKEKMVYLSKEMNAQKKTIVVIGPEGGFSDKEIEYAKQKGFKAVSLGESRLRTETAGIFVASVFNAFNNLK